MTTARMVTWILSRRRLNRIGDSVLVVGDTASEKIKVHVHTNNPGKALEYGLELGELVDLKIENILDERRAAEEAKAAERGG